MQRSQPRLLGLGLPGWKPTGITQRLSRPTSLFSGREPRSGCEAATATEERLPEETSSHSRAGRWSLLLASFLCPPPPAHALSHTLTFARTIAHPCSHPTLVCPHTLMLTLTHLRSELIFWVLYLPQPLNSKMSLKQEKKRKQNPWSACCLTA